MRQQPFDAFVQPGSAIRVEEENRRFILRVFRWMTLGLALTGLTALMVASTPALARAIVGNRPVFLLLVFGELGMVLAFNSVARRASALATMGLFLAYSLMNGLTLSVIFFAYTATSIAQVFFVTTATFGAMSIYGYATRRDLTSLGSFATMGLIGIVIAGVVNIFLASDMVGFVSACAGVLVFTGLTAYDTQKLKALNVIGHDGTDANTKEAVTGALILYLDFINLFLSLLRLMGRRR